MRQAGLFGLQEQRNNDGDSREVLGITVNFAHFRTSLAEGVGYGGGFEGVRPSFDPVPMFKALMLLAQQKLSDAHTEFMLRDRPSGIPCPSSDKLGVLT